MMSSTEENIDSSISTIKENSFLKKIPSINGEEDDLKDSSGIIEDFQFMSNLLDERQIPDLTNMEPWPATEVVADLLGIVDDETNHKSFWIVDTLAYCLKQMQEKGMHQSNQKSFVYWFFYILEKIHVYNWSREEAFSTLKVMFLRAEKIILSESQQIPIPQVCSENYCKNSFQMEEEDKNLDKKAEIFEITKEKSLKELRNLTDLIYSIFANRFKYEVIRTTFANTIRWNTIEIRDTINLPRTLLPLPPEKISRKEQKKRSKSSAIINDLAESDKDHILPLIKSVDQNFFDQMFPVAKKNKNKKKEKPKKKH